MRTVRTKVYKFNELKKDVQDKILKRYSEVLLTGEWWSNVYKEAENMGIKITSFDFYCGRITSHDFDETNVATKITLHYSEDTPIYNTAKKYLEAKHKSRREFFPVLYEEFRKNVMNDYLEILKQEYDYLTSRGSIEAFFEASEFEFYANGTKF